MHTHDIEKQRVEYVMLLEQQLKHARHELAEAKASSNHWKPEVGADMMLNESKTKFSMSYGGKVASVFVDDLAIAQSSEEDITNYIASQLMEALVAQQLRDLLRPITANIKKNVGARATAGKW